MRPHTHPSLAAFINSCIAIGLCLMGAAVLIAITGAPPVLLITAALITGAAGGLWITELLGCFTPRPRNAG
ncbi:hypothetical protein [Nocardiopsis metallicus]|uniref:Small-conductance mechanosensitive channel n=1 Tax=Nocardiopsis metallicus TaxID=179819 RepID=A0A840WEU8_9ACTN|nr:hypothetical protein [Nocardiopsis metallicus]MBB5494752.1 small-conductance mechanosensitive channel [Nocardiopsis metallicus]